MQLSFPPGTLPAEQPQGWTKAKELDLGLTLVETHGLGVIYFAILAIIRQVWVIRRIHAILMRRDRFRPQMKRPGY